MSTSMMNFTAEPATRADVVYLGPRLREADKQEIMAYAGTAPEPALAAGLQAGSETWTAIFTDDKGPRPCGMFGVVPDLDTIQCGVAVGFVWFLGTDDIFKAPVAFHRASKEWLERLGEHYDILTNCVDCRNARHTKWIRRMGFKFIRCHPKWGVEQRPFLQFSKDV